MAKNLNFNFDEFAVAAIKSIDEIRSYGKDGSANPIEPRINAFYRAIGLPAIVPAEENIPAMNNGNSFSSTSLDYEIFRLDFTERRIAFRREITQDEIDKFLLFNDSHISDSIKEMQDTTRRIRGVLFPMSVDGGIDVFPQDKRVADAFSTDDELRVGNVKYRRPLIEAIVLMRLKSEGAQDQNLQNKISQDFGSETLQDISKLGGEISKALINTTDGLTDLLTELIQIANKAKTQTGINLTPIIANIAQQSLSRNEVPEKMIGKADIDRQRLDERAKTQQAILTALEFDDSFVGDIKESRNVKDAMLTSSLLSVINSGISDQSKIQKDTENVERRRERFVGDVKESFRILDLLLGTFGSISGVDILVTIMALFKIPLNSLLGLLNDKAILNLQKIKGPNVANGKDTVTTAIDNLQNTVSDIFTQIESSASQTKHANKRSNQEEGET